MSSRSRFMRLSAVALLTCTSSSHILAQTSEDVTRIAVASNFSRTATQIAERFESMTGHHVDLIFGSTGRHYAQIMNGAPFDAVFSADTRRPEKLETEGQTVPGSRFTYALGRLILWSPKAGFVDTTGQVLLTGTFRHLAIANPRLAPYGNAAREVLESLGIWNEQSDRLVRGENISQAFNFVRSGNAELGFVALSQVVKSDATISGSYWIVPDHLYSPMEQQAVLLSDNEVARAFLAFVRSDEALSIIHSHGYATPPDAH